MILRNTERYEELVIIESKEKDKGPIINILNGYLENNHQILTIIR